MIVKELIELLAKLDQEKDIVYINNDIEDGEKEMDIARVVPIKDLHEYAQEQCVKKDIYIIEGKFRWFCMKCPCTVDIIEEKQ